MIALELLASSLAVFYTNQRFLEDNGYTYPFLTWEGSTVYRKRLETAEEEVELLEIYKESQSPIITFGYIKNKP